MPPRRHRPPTTHILDADDQVLEVGGQCGLYIDLNPGDTPPQPGDWIATKAGSRYLIDHTRVVRRRTTTPTRRYQMRCLRLPKHTTPPDDVHVIWVSWYPRGRT